MASICNSMNTEFTPSPGDFTVQVTGGSAYLWRRSPSSSNPALVGKIRKGEAVIVSNPVAGQFYSFTSASESPSVQADQ